MNVAELIQELQALDPDTEVHVRSDLYGGIRVRDLDDLCRRDTFLWYGAPKSYIEFGELV